MSNSIIQGILIASIIVVIMCLSEIVLIMWKHWKRQQTYIAQMAMEDEAIKFIEKRLPDIRLANRGFDIDQAIDYICQDVDVSFSMVWREDNEEKNL